MDSAFRDVDSLFQDLAKMTGHTTEQLIARWVAQNKGAKGASSWNRYLKYHADNEEEELARIGEVGAKSTQSLRARCYNKYREEYPDYEERLKLFEELDSYNIKGMTVAHRKLAFTKYVAKLRRMVCYVLYHSTSVSLICCAV
jgi:hypothetical protein